MPTNWEVIPFFFFVAFWIIIYLNRNYYKFHIEYYISQLMILCQKRSTESQASLKNYEREGASGWGTHVNPRLIHVNVWQKPLQYCKVISLQLIKINEKNYGKTNYTLVQKHASSLMAVSYTQRWGPGRDTGGSNFLSVIWESCSEISSLYKEFPW